MRDAWGVHERCMLVCQGCERWSLILLTNLYYYTIIF